MIKILLSILSMIVSFASLTKTSTAFGQTSSNFPAVSPPHEARISEEQWQYLTKRYYQSRYRTKFTADNNFLSLQDVRNVLGYPGSRRRVDKDNSHQYWHWQDANDPNKKIEAVFIYHRLVGLRSRGFDRQQLQQIKTEIINQTKDNRDMTKR